MAHSIMQPADDVWHVQGPASNWVVIADGGDLTLVDAGYPGDHADLIASLAAIGRRPEEIRAILVTHAHIDHIGGIPALTSERAIPVLTSRTEARHARREFLEQATPRDVAARAWRPRVLSWSVRIIRLGGLHEVAVEGAVGVEDGLPLDLPGHPVPLSTPGHTSGHVVYALPSHGVVVTGDALITGHPISSARGPQLIEDFFHHDADRAADSLEVISGVDADVVLPGHGPAWRGSPAQAVAQARGRR